MNVFLNPARVRTLFSINGPQHFERSASRIIEVRSIASQADHRVIVLTDWEWDGLFYHFKRTRGVSLLYGAKCMCYLRKIIICIICGNLN